MSEAAQALNPIFVAYGSLIAMAILPIYFGSKQAVKQEAKEESERLSKSDAYWFPVIGSGMLFGFYLLFNYFSKQYINYLLTVYFGAFGCASLSKIYFSLAAAAIPEKWYTFDHYRLFIERKRDGVLLDAKITWLHAACGLISLLTTMYYMWSKNWIANNLFSEAFAMTAIALIELDTFTTGMVLLSGLFVYDIFWVFGTNVMVSVAKSFDVPVKLLFPRNVFNIGESSFTMLGLGDIVIPGTMIALALKFDHHLAQKGHLKAGSTPYFNTALVFYLIGLVTTMVVMHTFKAAQPALLYLSPAGILSVLLTALARGELKEMLAFTTEVKETKEPEEHGSEEKPDQEEEEQEPVERVTHKKADAKILNKRKVANK